VGLECRNITFAASSSLGVSGTATISVGAGAFNEESIFFSYYRGFH
jgi:hypothetical protein